MFLDMYMTIPFYLLLTLDSVAVRLGRQESKYDKISKQKEL